MASASQRNPEDGALYTDTLQGGYIRLIRFLPAEDKLEPIRYDLFKVSFREAPKYEAISYMRGEPDIEQTVLINGIEIQVQQNLWDTSAAQVRGFYGLTLSASISIDIERNTIET
ncbi:uncharacterized protein PAC_17091 [Phialocephala subalpina]|uniref:Uncharacterized protein n=1 Tax=Phialocephala subalpina TaxID=576137 RepID=A0A1L7XQ61_9HELO|nr:uncharacterized protein PAC_17091 [Phialocephala subalpina]